MFHAEIQDGRQKWRENDFCEKLPVDSAETLWVKNFVQKILSKSLCVGQKFPRNRSISLCFRDKHIFAFNTEIQDGRQKWQENNFYEKSSVDFADTL